MKNKGKRSKIGKIKGFILYFREKYNSGKEGWRGISLKKNYAYFFGVVPFFSRSLNIKFLVILVPSQRY